MRLGSRLSKGCNCGCEHGGGAKPTVSCDPRNVKSISKVGSRVIVTFDDCTYVEAPASVVDVKSFCGDGGGTPPSVDLSEVTEKLSNLESRLATLETKVENGAVFDPTEIENKVQAVEAVIGKIRDNLVEIGNAKDETTHKAFNKNFTL